MRIMEQYEFDVDVSSWDLNESQWDEFKEDISELVSQYHADWHIPFPGEFVIGVQPGFDLDKDERLNLIEDCSGILDGWRKDGWPRDCGAIVY